MVKVRGCEVIEWLTKIVRKVDSHFGTDIYKSIEAGKTENFTFEHLANEICK